MRTCREVFACRHRETDVSADEFAVERDKAADEDDIFLFFTTRNALVDLTGTPFDGKVRAMHRARFSFVG